MIGCFPHLHSDELLYSACARYRDRVQYQADRAVVEELFGGRGTTALISFPSHLEHLVGHLPPSHPYTVDRLIDGHSFLPWFSPFLQLEKVARIRQDMAAGKGSSAYLRSGIASGAVRPPASLRYCPRCAEEDKQQLGESYWHRLHQLPGVKVCPVHEVFLEDSSARATGVQISYELHSADRNIEDIQPRSLTPSDPQHQSLLKIARDSAWLLQQHQLLPGLEALRSRYLSLLIRRGLATYTGQIRLTQLLREFQAFYPAEFLEMLQCEIREADRSNWLFRLVRPSKQARHPLYHLLLIQFLGYTAEEFFALSGEFQPFGDGPWPCLNSVCPQFQQPVIQAHQIIQDRTHGGRFTGIFACGCGFTYARLGPDMKPSDRFRVGKVKAYGLLWETKLREHWNNPALTLTQIAKTLGVYQGTVKRQAARLRLCFPRPGPTRATSDTGTTANDSIDQSKSNKRNAYREEWLAALENHPKASRTDLYQAYRRVYSWLRVYDDEWLRLHLPPARRRQKTPYPVDWHQRDVETAIAIRAAAKRLKRRPGKPKRITKIALASESSTITLVRSKLNRLPLTAQAISAAVDTTETYAVRRIRWAAAEFRQQGIEFKRWQLLHKASVSKKLSGLPEVQMVIEKELTQSNGMILRGETVHSPQTMAL